MKTDSVNYNNNNSEYILYICIGIMSTINGQYDERRIFE